LEKIGYKHARGAPMKYSQPNSIIPRPCFDSSFAAQR
jgi:hypothetical protein